MIQIDEKIIGTNHTTYENMGNNNNRNNNDNSRYLDI